ncbi:MAG: ankyrin repeat domain-containing protein [Acidobacteriota bacterium]|nr:ankyrin repeat domain-containing protein [Acidobacteriota bacterium]
MRVGSGFLSSSVRLAAAGLALAGGTAAPPALAADDVIAAARAGDAAAVRALLADGADVDARQGDGATALHWAAHRGDLALAEALLGAGADVDAANALDATPLWLASQNGDARLVALLLDAGADPDVTLKMGETPLMSAARSGDVATVELLLAAGADVDAAERERGQTALMWAAAQSHADVVRALASAGADLHARSRVWHQLENTAGNTNPIGNFRMAHGGSTALLFAARNGDAATARVLLAAGADVDDTAAAGTSALVVAAHSGHRALAELLLERGADPNAAGAGYTALHAAVLRGQGALVRALLAHGADPNAPVVRGTPGRRFSADYSIRHQAVGANAFWLAAKYGELESLGALADHGADPFMIPANGVSALQAAIGRAQISQENRRNRVGVPAPDDVDQEALAMGLARVVIALGVDVNTADERGETPLHDAVRNGYASVVEFLVRRGADVRAANNRDQTALTLAETPLPVPGTNGRRATRPEIAALLRSYGDGQ